LPSFTECKEIFPDLPDQDLLESVKQAVELNDRQDLQAPAIEPGSTKVQAETPQPETHSQIYRRVFVGREAELNELRSNFDGAMSGQGLLVMVVGEPGTVFAVAS
jgi:transcriptional regulator with AAA-type ATPase domain